MHVIISSQNSVYNTMSFSIIIGLSDSLHQSFPYLQNHPAVHFDSPVFYSPDQYHTYETVILCVLVLQHFQYLCRHQIGILHTNSSCCVPWSFSNSILVPSPSQYLTHGIILLFILIVQSSTRQIGIIHSSP